MIYPVESLEWSEYGNGEPPILLLHGWGGDMDTLTVLGQPLSQLRRIVGLSLPGFGRSPEPPEPWSSRDYLDFVVAWMSSRDLSRVDIIAHSFGARIALRLAATHSERVGKLIIVAGAGIKPPRHLRTRVRLAASRTMKLAAQALGGTAAAWLEKRRSQLGSPDWKAASPVMRGTLSRVLREDLSDECRQITAPTLLIWGDADPETPPVLGRRMAALIPLSQLMLLPGAGHYCFLERHGEVLSHVWRHLSLPEAWK